VLPQLPLQRSLLLISTEKSLRIVHTDRSGSSWVVLIGLEELSNFSFLVLRYDKSVHTSTTSSLLPDTRPTPSVGGVPQKMSFFQMVRKSFLSD